jgi:glycosyltransferase involved in cell wall biosynthesis
VTCSSSASESATPLATEMGLPDAALWIDGRATQGAGSAERGLGRHVVELVDALHELSPEALGSIRLDSGLPAPEALASLEGEGLLGWGLDPPRRGEALPSLYHVPAPFESQRLDGVWPEWIRSGRHQVRTVVTLHDLVPLVMSDLYLRDNLLFKTVYEARLGLIRSAHQVLAISDNTAADAVRHLGIDPARITLISSGVSDSFSSLVTSVDQAAEILRRTHPSIRGGFLLYVGGGDPRKNMRRTVEAFARLPSAVRRSHQLVVVCKLGPQVTGELRVYARRLGIDDADLVFVGFVPDRELAAMYRSCALFVFPSLYEGFGLPILEAMSCGAPVAAAENSSIPEVLGDLRGTFDAADPNHIAATLHSILEDPEELQLLRERSRRRVAQFTWERVARKVLEGYERALRVPAGRWRGRPRKRIAVAAPWPPAASRAAASSERLVTALAERADVDVLARPTAKAFDRTPRPGVRVWGIDELDWLLELRSHDGYVYVLDGDPRDGPIMDALVKRPGIVLLHDVRLQPIYEARAEARWVDQRGRTALLERAAQPLREVQQHATALIVASREQLDALQKEEPADAAPTELIPPEKPGVIPERVIELLDLG